MRLYHSYLLGFSSLCRFLKGVLEECELQGLWEGVKMIVTKFANTRVWVEGDSLTIINLYYRISFHNPAVVSQ